MFKRAALLGIIALPTLLTGCGIFGGIGSNLNANLNPTNLGFEVDDQGEIVIAANAVTFVNRAGAAEALITGYEIRFYNDGGTELIGIGSELYNHHQAIIVPAGVICEVEDLPLASCPLAQRHRTTQQSEEHTFTFVPADIATEMLTRSLTRVQAEITFYAEQGGSPTEWSQGTTVTYPVGVE